MPEDETTPGTESDKDKNFRALEEAKNAEIEQLKARIGELEPLEHEKTVRAAGFDPDTGEGKALVKSLTRGEVTPTDGEELPKAVAAFAKSEYGWEPKAAAPDPLTPTEQAQVSGEQTRQPVATASTSQVPADINARIQAAQDAGDAQLYMKLSNDLLRSQMEKQAAG